MHGTLLDGTPYDGPDELKRQLMKHGDEFVTSLAEKLTVYALGRGLELSDRPELESICAKAAADGYGLHALVDSVIQCDLFRCK